MWMNWLAAAIIIGLVLIPAVYYGWMHSTRLEKRSGDALIVLGKRSEQGEIDALLQERLDTAIRLYRQYRYKFIILSGGAVGFEKSEAEIMQDYLVRQGIPNEVIILEALSRNTVQNMANCRLILQQSGLTECLFVSNSFHIRRMKFIARKLKMNASFYASRSPRSILCDQWRLTFKEIRAFRLSLPWIDKVSAR